MKSITAEQRNHMLLCDPVSRVIPKLAVPTIISMLITNIYNMADTFFVSQLGTSASGAVGVIFSAMAIIQAVSFMIGMGAGTHVSQALGAGNREKADAYASTSFFTAFIAGVILAFFSLTNIDAVVRFQMSGCYAVSTSLRDNENWSQVQAALDTFIRGGLNALRAHAQAA